MNYVKRSANGVIVSSHGNLMEHKIGLKAYINHQCMDRLASYEGIVKATRALLGFYQLTPVYVKKNVLIFSTKSMRNIDCVFINFCEISHIKKNNHMMDIIFYDQCKLTLKASHSIMRTQMKRCCAINDFLTKKSLESVYNYGLSIEI